jgi:hypothetical protein
VELVITPELASSCAARRQPAGSHPITCQAALDLARERRRVVARQAPVPAHLLRGDGQQRSGGRPHANHRADGRKACQELVRLRKAAETCRLATEGMLAASIRNFCTCAEKL